MVTKVIDLTGTKDTVSLPAALSVQSSAKKAVPRPTTIPSEKQLALRRAIETARPERVRQILQNLCDISTTNEVYVAALLLITEEGQGANATRPKSRKRSASTNVDDEEVDEAGDSEAQKPRAAKRLRARYAICTQCDEEFDVTENNPEDCVYHPGM
jgi:hypothetical protein